MARVWLPPQSDPWLALREPALLVPNRLPIGNAVLRRDGLARGLTACFVADGGTMREVITGAMPSTDAASGERYILGAVGPEYSGGSGVNTQFANESRFAPVNGTGFTIAVWFDVDTLTNYSAIAAFQQTTTTDGWELRLGGAGGATGSDFNFAQFNAVGVRAWRSGANRYSAGQKQAFIACSRDGQLIQTAPVLHWGTGSVVASASVGGAVGNMTVPASREMYIGHRYDNVTRLDGAVGMLLIYDRALSVAELDALYARGPAALFEPAANEPIFIGTAAGGGAFTLTADAASYSLTGQDAALIAARTVTAESTAYNYTGQDAGLLAGFVVPADATSYTYNAADAGLVATRVLTADSVSYTHTGQDATLTYTPAAKILTAESTSYTYTAADAALAVGFRLSAESTSYALTGQETTLRATRTLPADATSYTYIGQDANLIYTAVGAFTLVADPASFLLTAQDVALTATRTVPADLVVYSWSGQDANLSTGLGLVADQATYTYTPADATFSRTYVVSAEAVAYVLTGQAVTFRYSGTPVWIEVASATGVWTETPSAGGTWTEIN